MVYNAGHEPDAHLVPRERGELHCTDPGPPHDGGHGPFPEPAPADGPYPGRGVWVGAGHPDDAGEGVPGDAAGTLPPDGDAGADCPGGSGGPGAGPGRAGHQRGGDVRRDLGVCLVVARAPGEPERGVLQDGGGAQTWRGAVLLLQVQRRGSPVALGRRAPVPGPEHRNPGVLVAGVRVRTLAPDGDAPRVGQRRGSQDFVTGVEFRCTSEP